MAVTLTFVGPITRPPPERLAAVVDHGPYTNVHAFLGALGYQPVQFPYIAVLVDGARLHASDPTPDSGELVIMVPTGGG